MIKRLLLHFREISRVKSNIATIIDLKMIDLKIWVTFPCDGTGPADQSKRTKRVQGWSRLNWLSGIPIIVCWHIHLNKLLMSLTPVCCFAN